ncbi:tumor necrosis factor-like [Pelobates fuscus]|uniref:tumor necrosis factor-like n=1 Tax=Pelobates fuscus TaxID=191477 RepID=UPI002FE4579B
MNNVESQMENGLLVVREIKPKQRFCHWLGICSFVLLLVATVILALLHFEILPRPAKKDEIEMPEFVGIKTFLDSVPQEARAQTRVANKLAAHLTGVRSKNEISWKGESQNSFLENEMKLKNNALVIPKDGLYFVYTQVIFTGLSCVDTNAIQLTHKVNKYSDSEGDSSPILTSTKTACEVQSKSAWFHPIYQGGIFQLDKGDVLSTSTTDIKYVDTNNGKTYFGILAI